MNSTLLVSRLNRNIMKGWSNFRTGVLGIGKEKVTISTPVAAVAVAPASSMSSVAL
uniref:Uncharacterized protein n=1 Tax=Anguilla anguilla TaxID=7936 RepID=A0A0E9Y1S8_ANGAN